MEILEKFLDFADWDPPQILLDCLLESCLLPLIETAFRSGSMIQMSKQIDLVSLYLKLVRILASNPKTIHILGELDDHYEPKQLNSV